MGEILEVFWKKGKKMLVKKSGIEYRYILGYTGIEYRQNTVSDYSLRTLDQ